MPEGNGRVTRPMTAEAPRRVEAVPQHFVPPQHFYRTAALACPYVLVAMREIESPGLTLMCL